MRSVIKTAAPRKLLAAVSLTLAAVALICGTSRSTYGGIVTDGGFESADPGGTAGNTDYFTTGQSIDGGSWLVTQGTVGVDTQNLYVYQGNKSVYLSGSGNDNSMATDSLTQTLNTVIGDTYTIGFWANADTPNTFSVTFGGAAVNGAPASIAQNGFPSNNWLGNSSLFTYYSGTATATATRTDLVFSAAYQGNSDTGVTVEIDNVDVTGLTSATPEPATFPLTALGLGLAGMAVARRRRVGA